ncbi:hypothetical protein D3C85_1577270 [compost metagenome]
MLDREPTVGPIAHVRVYAKSKLLNVERERLVLILDVYACDIDTFVHDSSLVDARTVSLAWRRRFSKTAVPRSGRCAAFSTQAGMPPWGMSLRASLRMAPGLWPVMSRKMRPKVPRLSQPVE